VLIKWLAEYCGTSVAMIEKHYGKYVHSDAAKQLSKLAGTVTQTVTQQQETAVNQTQGAKNSGGKVGGPTWIRTRDQPVMSRWL
jgi:hypothetical protein